MPFYLSPSTRPSPSLNRDAPSVIRARIRAVTLACLAASLITLYLLLSFHQHSENAATTSPLFHSLHTLGYLPTHPSTFASPVLLTAILFLGPLFEKVLVERINPSDLLPTLRSWMGYRNFIASPITEELLFRSCIIPLHLLGHTSAKTIIFASPLYFGIAHVHHFYEFTLTHPHTPLLPILLRSVFQFSYTTLFGWYASLVFLRSANIYTCILIHAFCNWIGFPRFWGRVQRGEEYVAVGPYGPNPAAGRDNDDDNKPNSHRAWKATAPPPLHGAWTVAYYLLLVFGVVGFYLLLWPLTEYAGDGLVAFV